MSNFKLVTPVAFLIFNRPDTTDRVFQEIRRARPPKLLVVADGPRSDQPDDIAKCAAARAVIDRVDWDCEVLTNYSEKNLGCKRRVSSGIDWVFEVVPEAIILEDDCLPHPTFFKYCQDLLELYREDERVMHISGNNFQSPSYKANVSYYFSKHTHVWGWASWRRAWHKYDVSMAQWLELRRIGWLSKLFPDKNTSSYWTGIFDYVHSGRIDTWDYQWAFAVMCDGLAIAPSVNLVSNIGFDNRATHTQQVADMNQIAAYAMSFPLRHPEQVTVNLAADTFEQRTHYRRPSVLIRGRSAVTRIARQFLART